MKYVRCQIMWDWNEFEEVGAKNYLSWLTLNELEIPFVRQWTNEWKYLHNWSARRDKFYITDEGYARKVRSLLVTIQQRPVWDFRQLSADERRTLDQLQEDGLVDYDTVAREYFVTDKGQSFLSGDDPYFEEGGLGVIDH